MRTGNLFNELPPQLPEELFDTVATAKDARIERIVSLGHASPENFWYDQDEDEWVLIVAGEAKLAFDDGKVLHLFPGMHVYIPAHCRHRVEWTHPSLHTVWLAVFLG